MSQAFKVTFFTTPLSLIHIAAVLGIVGAGLMLMGADMRFIENVPLLGTVQNTPGMWAIITMALAIIAVASNPIFYINPCGASLSDALAGLVGMLSGFMIPVMIGLAIVTSPFFILLALDGGMVYLSAHLAVAVYFLLMVIVPSLR